MSDTMIEELRSFAAAHVALPENADPDYWFHARDLPANDFNREIAETGHPDCIDGCLRIMCDDDFYEVARLPLKFTALGCAEIVGVLWPELDSPVIRPDHGDHWWTAVGDDTLEVPGQPFELWVHVVRGDEVTESIRLECYSTRAEADERGKMVFVSSDDEARTLWRVRWWADGARHEGEMRATTVKRAVARASAGQ